MGLGRFSGCESHTLSAAFQSLVNPTWWAKLWWPELCSARTSSSDTHTLVTPSRGVGVAAAAIPVIRCRCAQSAAYHRFVCAAVDSLLRMPFYLRSIRHTVHCLHRLCGTSCAARTLSASQTCCFATTRFASSRCFATRPLRGLGASHQLGILGSGVGYVNCG